VNKPNRLANLILLRCWLQIEKYTMHISRSEDLLSRLSQQERRFAKR
jgi:GINS complex subunit 4